MARRNVAVAFGATLCLALAAGCSSAAGPASDPACPTAKTTAHSLGTSLTADMNAARSAGANAGLLTTDVNNAALEIGDAQTAISTLLAKSTSTAVKAPLQDLNAKLAQVSGDFGGNSTNIITAINTLIGQAKTDETALDSACGTTANG
jgi:hypothetical protein